MERLWREGADTTFTYAGSIDAANHLAEQTGTTAVQLDVADRNALTEFIKSQGPLDKLVINAGVFLMGDALELDPDDIERMIDINVRAPYHAAVEAAREMPEGGRTIVIGSVNADRIPMPGATAYALSKSAIQGMVQGLARDLGPRNITVNNVQPGPTDTSMNPADGPYADVMHSFMALKRHGKAEEIASFVAYIASPEAGFVTGANHSVDGGFAA